MDGAQDPSANEGFSATPLPAPADAGDPKDNEAVAPAFTLVEAFRYAVNVFVPSVNVRNALLFSVVLVVPTFLTWKRGSEVRAA